MLRLGKLKRLTWSDFRLLVEAALWLSLARLALWGVPFKYLALRLGHRRPGPPAAGGPAFEAEAAKVGWAIQVWARRLPWTKNCLVQSIAAKRLLRLRRLPSTLYLGVAKDDARRLKAHAWVRCGPVVVAGAGDHQAYTVVSIFVDEPD